LALGHERTYVRDWHGRIESLCANARADPLLAAFASEPPALYGYMPVLDVGSVRACYAGDDGVQCISWAANPFAQIDERQPWSWSSPA
jgi:hypothetical protein